MLSPDSPQSAITTLATALARDPAAAIRHYDDPDFGCVNRGGGEAEDAILIPCALRIDAYPYLEVTGFDPQAAVETFQRTGAWDHLDLAERMCCFFTLQRYLYKWGGERLGRDAPAWRAFRSLFLAVHAHGVPTGSGIKPNPDYIARWRRLVDTTPIDVAGVIRAIHEATEYTL